MTLKEFQKERTRIISEMLDNPDEIGIYPTTKCYEELDKLFESLLPSPEQTDARVEAYKKILRLINVPEIIIEHPEFVEGREPSFEDVKWAMDAIEKLNSLPVQPPTGTSKVFSVEDSLIDFLNELTADPYPEDVFLPIPTNVLEMIHSTLMEEYKMPLDRLTGHIGRRLRRPLSEKATQFLNSIKQK